MFTQDLLIKAVQEYKNVLPTKHYDFLSRVYLTNLERYQRRLINYGFKGKECVLDAGCGFGQWSIYLSQLNQEVYAVDNGELRIQFLNKLVNDFQIKNLNPLVSNLELLPFKSEKFDAIFCYGVIFLTDWKKTLHELSRVLRPGGIIYLNANGLGWYKHLWQTKHNKVEGYDPQLITAKALMNTWKYNNGQGFEIGTDIVIEPSEIIQELNSLNFINIRLGSEAQLQTTTNVNEIELPFFKGHYGEDLGVYEIMAEKAKMLSL